ncbi:alpha/beta hydrolase [Streptomyces sp. NPDC057099]|uniref:alpha/beta hydrolase n=1 Tax=Streptomyces sp. NPDC057099 TaxID=3346019 RepID=UPI00362D2909
MRSRAPPCSAPTAPIRVTPRPTTPSRRRAPPARVSPDAYPILVVGTRYDPSTPLTAAQAMASELADARLLTNDGYGHPSLRHTRAERRHRDGRRLAGSGVGDRARPGLKHAREKDLKTRQPFPRR